MLFLLQSGILYLLEFDATIEMYIEAMFASSLIMCFSFGFIMIVIGLEMDDLDSNSSVLYRHLGIILIMLSFASFLLVIQEIEVVYY